MSTSQQTAPRGGRLRRLLYGSDDPPDITAAGHRQRSAIIDIRPVTPPDLDTIYLKVQRLEQGLQLIAHTMKRAHADLTAALDDLRGRLEGSATRSDLHRVVTEAFYPLNDAIGQLIESTRGLPLILSATADRLADRFDAARNDMEDTMIAMLAGQPERGQQDASPAAAGSEAPDAPVAATEPRAAAIDRHPSTPREPAAPGEGAASVPPPGDRFAGPEDLSGVIEDTWGWVRIDPPTDGAEGHPPVAGDPARTVSADPDVDGDRILPAVPFDEEPHERWSDEDRTPQASWEKIDADMIWGQQAGPPDPLEMPDP